MCFLQSTVHRTINVVQNIQSMVLDNLVTNEGPIDIETETLSLQVEKKTAKTLGGTGNNLKKCRFKSPSGDAFGLGECMWLYSDIIIYSFKILYQYCLLHWYYS